MKVWEKHKGSESVTVWVLEPHDNRPGEYYIETAGDPSLTAAEFVEMATAVSRDARNITTE